ncbi:MAG: FAD-binding protein [Desulfovibrio sp.]|nr:FAD-binding protein [Desulfovibrio sp.]
MKGISVKPGPRLSERTGIGLGGRALAEVHLEDVQACEKLPALLSSLGGTPVMFGAGSNIIAADEDLPLTLVSLRPSRKEPLFGKTGEKILVRAEASMPLPALLRAAAARGLGGLEGLAGIPGSVGGAVAMNAGSFGTETGSLLHSLTLFSPSFGMLETEADKAVFSYRNGSFAGLPFGGAYGGGQNRDWLLVLAATFALVERGREEVREKMRACYARKKSSQPLAAKSAGCVFKNPSPDQPAGYLLEQAGMKGKGAGGMRFSTLHANFLTNEGNGSYAAARDLMEEAVAAVEKTYGLLLEKEVRVWA